MDEPKYEKQELIGSGSFGRAWLVRRTSNGRKYALKEIRVAGLSDRERGQAMTEVEALSRCLHLNVVRYREAFLEDLKTANPVLCIVMEYAESGDLRKKIDSQNGVLLDGKLILDWFVQICFALKYIHGVRILHRDLKTANVFLTCDGIVKVGDFGIARILNETSEQASTVIGTPYYLSPEICQHQPYGFKSDMWSAGCVLYELCTLNRPFTGSTITELIVNILRVKYTPLPSQHGPLLEDLVGILLRSDPGQRPTAAEVLSIPLVRPLADIYVQRANAMARRRTSLPSLDSPTFQHDVIFNDRCSAPGSLRRDSGCQQPQRAALTVYDANEGNVQNGGCGSHEKPVKVNVSVVGHSTPSGGVLTDKRSPACRTEATKYKENNARVVRHNSCGTPVVFARPAKGQENALSENQSTACAKKRLSQQTSTTPTPKMSVYREVLKRNCRESSEKTRHNERILGGINDVTEQQHREISRYSDEKQLRIANNENSPTTSSSYSVAYLDTCRALLAGYAPSLSSIPSRLELIRRSLRTKFGPERFCQLSGRIRQIVVLAASSSSADNNRQIDLLLSSFSSDILQHMSLFIQLIQLETLTGIAN